MAGARKGRPDVPGLEPVAGRAVALAALVGEELELLAEGRVEVGPHLRGGRVRARKWEEWAKIVGLSAQCARASSAVLGEFGGDWGEFVKLLLFNYVLVCFRFT